MLDRDADSRPSMAPPPARVRIDRLDRPRAALVGWPHLLVNGSDAEFCRMVRALAAPMHRLEEVCALAARSVGLTGVELGLLLAIVEADRDGDGVAQRTVAREVGVSLQYASHLAVRLVRAGMVVKRPDPVHLQRKLLMPTEAGREAVAAATPLIEGANDVVFQALDGRGFERLRKIAAALDSGSTIAVDIVARRTGEELDTSIRELRRTARRDGS